jgi:acyl carrier protein
MHEKIKSIFADMFIMDPGDINFDMPLKEYGIDSLDFTEFMLMLENEFDVDIEDKDVDQLKTLNDVIKYLQQQ